MLTATWARSNPERLKRLTGLNLGQFARLVLIFTRLRANGYAIERAGPRVRHIGGGRRGKLSTIEDQVLFILVYYRHYPTQEFCGMLFGLSQPQVCDRVAYLSKVLERALGKAQVKPQRPPDRGDFIIQQVPGLQYIIDGCDRLRSRPSKEPEQTIHFSGKNKRHSFKNNVIIDARTRKIVGLGRTHPGKCHDKYIADQDRCIFPVGSTLTQDTGFQGYAPSGAIVRQPKKKPKGKELTPWDKFNNRTISMDRVLVEHAIYGFRISRIVRDKFRNRRTGFSDQVAEIAAGIYNLKKSA